MTNATLLRYNINMEIEKLLKLNGLKITAIRKAVLFLFTDCRPLSAVEILNGVQKSGLSPNKSTIYREIETLQRAGVISPMSLDGKNTVYELCSHHHHHLVCINCKSVKSISCKSNCSDNFSPEIQNNKFEVVNSSVNIFGYCATCKEGK